MRYGSRVAVTGVGGSLATILVAILQAAGLTLEEPVQGAVYTVTIAATHFVGDYARRSAIYKRRRREG